MDGFSACQGRVIEARQGVSSGRNIPERGSITIISQVVMIILIPVPPGCPYCYSGFIRPAVYDTVSWIKQKIKTIRRILFAIFSSVMANEIFRVHKTLPAPNH
jgi:hypothetical protein